MARTNSNDGDDDDEGAKNGGARVTTITRLVIHAWVFYLFFHLP